MGFGPFTRLCTLTRPPPPFVWAWVVLQGTSPDQGKEGWSRGGLALQDRPYHG